MTSFPHDCRQANMWRYYFLLINLFVHCAMLTIVHTYNNYLILPAAISAILGLCNMYSLQDYCTVASSRRMDSNLIKFQLQKNRIINYTVTVRRSSWSRVMGCTCTRARLTYMTCSIIYIIIYIYIIETLGYPTDRICGDNAVH